MTSLSDTSAQRTREHLRPCLPLTNPCAKQKFLSLTKPKGKIYKTKSLGHYITHRLRLKKLSLKLSNISNNFNSTVFHSKQNELFILPFQNSLVPVSTLICLFWQYRTKALYFLWNILQVTYGYFKITTTDHVKKSTKEKITNRFKPASKNNLKKVELVHNIESVDWGC